MEGEIRFHFATLTPAYRQAGYPLPKGEGIMKLVVGAGEGNRTLLASLEGWSITTMLLPHGRGIVL